MLFAGHLDNLLQGKVFGVEMVAIRKLWPGPPIFSAQLEPSKGISTVLNSSFLSAHFASESVEFTRL